MTNEPGDQPKPQYADDPEIADTENLLRRLVRHAGWFSSKDGSLTALVFLDRNGLVSVHRRSLTTIERICEAYPNVGLAQITAGVARQNLHGVAADPIEDDPSHALLVASSELTGEKRKEAARRLAKAAEVVRAAP